MSAHPAVEKAALSVCRRFAEVHDLPTPEIDGKPYYAALDEVTALIEAAINEAGTEKQRQIAALAKAFGECVDHFRNLYEYALEQGNARYSSTRDLKMLTKAEATLTKFKKPEGGGE